MQYGTCSFSPPLFHLTLFFSSRLVSSLPACSLDSPYFIYIFIPIRRFCHPSSFHSTQVALIQTSWTISTSLTRTFSHTHNLSHTHSLTLTLSLSHFSLVHTLSLPLSLPTGNLDGAVSAYGKALEVNPWNTTASSNLSFLLTVIISLSIFILFSAQIRELLPFWGRRECCELYDILWYDTLYCRGIE